MSTAPTALTKVTFDAKLKTYLVLYTSTIMASTLVGFFALPFWLVLGPMWASRYFRTIEAELTPRSLVYKHGVWFRQEMNIPLDKIQDIALLHGPFLNALGLCTLRIETAGGGANAAAGVRLVGVVDAESFRAQVIAQRDSVVASGSPAPDQDDVLIDIRDSLLRIEDLLRPKPD